MVDTGECARGRTVGPLGGERGHANTNTYPNSDTNPHTNADSYTYADANSHSHTYASLRTLCCRYQLSGRQRRQQCGWCLSLRCGRMVFNGRICL